MFDKLKYVIGDKIRENQIAKAEGGKNEKKQKGGKHRKPTMCTATARHTIKGSKHIDHACGNKIDPSNPNQECSGRHLCRHLEVNCDYQWN